ncbi:uncharacterized protein KD926_001500 [Aspergillus affinis]|uniref:uncharacterized protein n=1 Tax=Aspergillus affinis TaxID=1070780 RepID=UPI0022FE1118|nr:uncharacterized protein KD926_001500 [Aspergillus affinis]KAI9044270.1 hypothetical protein KD926_001500 [Aspergillus affinis]
MTSLWPDLAAASLSASLISPVIALIDKSLIPKNNSPALPARPKPPVSLARPFGIVWTLYATTYTVANTGDSLSSRVQYQHAALLASAATIAVNVPLGIWKDLRFAQMFAGGATAVTTAAKTAQEAVSTVSKEVVGKEISKMGIGSGRWKPASAGGGRLATGAFLMRDVITIVASFTLAPRCAEYLTTSGMLDSESSENHGALAMKTKMEAHPHEISQKATIIAQLAVPVLSQVVATPVHLVGLDSFSRPMASWAERMAFVRKHVLPTTVGRCLRIIPAFGVGLVVNTELRLFFA